MFDLDALLACKVSGLSHPRRRWLFVLAIGFLFATYMVVGLNYGPYFTPDGKRDFYFANLLVDSGFNPWLFAERVRPLQPLYEMPQSPLQYFVYLCMLAFAGAVAGAEYWGHVVVSLNALFYTATAAIMIAFIAHLTDRLLTTVMAAVAMGGIWEFIQWVTTTQSDPLYLLLCTAAGVLTVLAANDDRGRARRYLLFAGAIGLLSIATRPTWFPLIAFLLAAIILLNVLRLSTNVRAAAAMFFLTMLLLVAVGIALHAYVIFDPGQWSWPALREMAEFLRPYHAQGWVQWARPETYTSPPESELGFMAVSALRLVYFFWFLADDFSLRHILLNVMTFPLFYAFVGLGLIAVWLRPPGMPPSLWRAGILACLYILTVDAYHAVTILDYDWRYRLPTLWAFIVLAAIGLETITGWLAVRRSCAQLRQAKDQKVAE